VSNLINQMVPEARLDGRHVDGAIVSVTAIGPVSFLNATSLINAGQPQRQSPLPEDIQKTSVEAADVALTAGLSPSGKAATVQAFTAFPPAVQPIASLSPGGEIPQALPVDLGLDSTDSARNGPGSWWMFTLSSLCLN
jgi:hypothetical protein